MRIRVGPGRGSVAELGMDAVPPQMSCSKTSPLRRGWRQPLPRSRGRDSTTQEDDMPPPQKNPSEQRRGYGASYLAAATALTQWRLRDVGAGRVKPQAAASTGRAPRTSVRHNCSIFRSASCWEMATAFQAARDVTLLILPLIWRPPIGSDGPVGARTLLELYGHDSAPRGTGTFR